MRGSGGTAPCILNLKTLNGKLYVQAALPLVKERPVPVMYEVRWFSELVEILWRRKESLSLARS
jgi:hypothetical protein